MLKLAAAARIFVRPGPAIQFGVDARTSGVITDIDPSAIGGVVAAIDSAKKPQLHSTLLEKLIKAGIARAAARSLLVDLTAYRILHPVPIDVPEIALLGRSELAGCIAELLEKSGCQIRRPLRGESDRKFLNGVAVGKPLIVTDRISHGRRFAPALRGCANSLYVPVAIVDACGIIGPIAIGGRGPCPMCQDLYRAQADPHWHHVSAQLPAGPTEIDSEVVLLTAASVAGVVKQHLGLAGAAPGITGRELRPGWRMRVDPYSGMREDIIYPHRLCPLCFAAQHL